MLSEGDEVKKELNIQDLLQVMVSMKSDLKTINKNSKKRINCAKYKTILYRNKKS